MQHYDSVIIGSGQAAPSLAAGLAKRGQKVALVEGDRLGGTCINAGCTPSKTLRKSARVAHLARRAADFGVMTGPVEVDFKAAMARMNERVNTSREGLTSWLGSIDGLTIIRGWGSFDGRDEEGRFIIAIDGQRVSADRVYINTGTHAFWPPIPGLGDAPCVDNSGLLALQERPDHLIVVGGSYIGLELAQIFRRLGSEVSVIHRAPVLAGKEDPDVSQIIADILQDEGVKLHLNVAIEKTGRNMRGVLVTLADGTEVAGSHLLLATGRAPNTEKLNLGSIGLETDRRGYLQTDGLLRTSVPGVWALGDVNGRGAFTHTSYHDHEIVLADLDGLEERHQWTSAERRPTTYAMFIDPPLGRVGISLTEAKSLAAQGRNLLVSEMPMSQISRAKEEGEMTGFIRLIVDGDTEALIGATVFGISGDEIIAVLSNYMATGASYRIMQQALPVHPTVAELLPTILSKLQPLEAEIG